MLALEFAPSFGASEIAEAERGRKVLQQMLQGLVAQTQETPPGGIMSSPLPVFVLIFVAMYFLIIRPQQKQQKQQREFLSQLKKGDEVLLSGGLFGRIHEVREVDLTVEIASGVKVRVLKSAVSRGAPEGTTPGAASNEKSEKKS